MRTYLAFVAACLALTGPLVVRVVARDRYGRLVAQVRNAAGVDLSCAMLAAGAIYRADWDNGGLVGRTCGRR